MFIAWPDDNGFKASFSDFKVTHLPDKIRSEWLKTKLLPRTNEKID